MFSKKKLHERVLLERAMRTKNVKPIIRLRLQKQITYLSFLYIYVIDETKEHRK